MEEASLMEKHSRSLCVETICAWKRSGQAKSGYPSSGYPLLPCLIPSRGRSQVVYFAAGGIRTESIM
ncbi:hypothetical protein JOE65_002176 [Arthrobacter roseus]|nr:hypothetical protein [Arthrobacter roseus]